MFKMTFIPFSSSTTFLLHVLLVLSPYLLTPSRLGLLWWSALLPLHTMCNTSNRHTARDGNRAKMGKYFPMGIELSSNQFLSAMVGTGTFPPPSYPFPVGPSISIWQVGPRTYIACIPSHKP